MSMAYAYNSTDMALMHTIFQSYQIRNTSTHNYKDLYIGFFADFDIGDATDDYIGCDTSLNLVYGYNGKEIDGTGQIYAYGTHPPAQGAMFLNQKMSAFMYYNNTLTGPPESAVHYYNYLQAKWKDLTPLTLWGTGYNTNSTDYTNFAFSGDPATKNGWVETAPNGPCSPPNVPGDKRGVMSADPFTLPAGKSICIDIALPFARSSEGDNFTAVTLLKERAQAIQQFYNSQKYENSCAENIGIIENKLNLDKIQIFPNPSNGRFTVTSKSMIESIELYNVLGQKVFSDNPSMQSAQIDTQLPQGLYIYRIILQDSSICSGKIIVQ